MHSYPLILLANEPGTYRSLLAEQLPFLRPDLRVLEVLPADLNAAVSTYHPTVVLGSEPMQDLQAQNIATLVLYPQGDDSFLQTSSGSETVVRQPRLSDILAAIDRAVVSATA